MATDNQDIVAPTGGVTKSPAQTQGRWRNLIVVGAMTALLGTGLGWIGHGVGIKYENRPVTGSTFREVSTDCLNVGLVIETTPGGFASGSGVQVITCLSTRDGSIRVDSGALLVGKVAGVRTLTVSGTTLGMRGTVSGTTLNVSGLGAATLTTGAVPCIKAGGLIGWMRRTATGTLLATCN